ncbi:hypothetical protein [Salinispora arenicola]|uniref:hypothetical protein n=1 Tax=Salinispora arenicola TaxID=168697 RepID=UPI00036E47E6|nr:hypothetical protein [Salinispora arenicola]
MSREEDDAVALVRVYCGLASADPADRPASAGSALTSAVVDDAGRLLHISEISDDPAGYAQLVTLLVDRSGGPSGAAIAADSDDHTVTSLLSAAGRPLAIADDDSVDDFAERFADDDSPEEVQAPPVERRAVGLARALQAGALSAVTLPAPRDLAGYKQVLAAHAALANGRHSAAVALREVLRELFPAALQAYPDPAAPVALAVLDALPEPGILAGPGRDQSATRVTADLTAEGVAASEVIEAAITALRVAISETPRRASVNPALTAAVSTTVRQAVASVRACDVGCAALVGALDDRAGSPAPGRRAATRHGAPLDKPPSTDAARTSGRPGVPPRPATTGARRPQPEPVSGQTPPPSPRPLGPPPVAPAPVAPPPVAPQPIAPAAVAGAPVPAAPGQPEPMPNRVDAPTNRPISPPPPPPPGITPIPPSQRGSIPPAEAGEPFRATLTTAAIQEARAERQRTATPPRSHTASEPPTPSGGFSVTDLSVPVPTPRPAQEPAPPGSRANWPLVNNADPADSSARVTGADTYGGQGVDAPTDPSAERRVPPPWLADDMPQEPPVLRLVEPPPLADRALRDGADPRLETPPLRLVDEGEPNDHPAAKRPAGQQMPPMEHRPPPVTDDGDGDLLIFAQAKSAWFVGQSEDDEVDWSSLNDTGWQAAEQAAKPATGSETPSGLPKRVPQANLVPGSPKQDDRPLRIVRDPASLAENTTGYFRGWRRGQEIGGFAVGGRPGREAAGGWDFTRDTGERDEDRKYEYRSAGYRS